MQAREAAYLVLAQVERDNAYANICLAQLLANIDISPRDARLAAQIVYGSVRQRYALDHILTQLLTRPLTQLKKEAQIILRLSLFQMHYLTNAEPYAVVNEAVVLAKKYATPQLSGLVNGVLRNYLRHDREKMLPGMDNLRDYLHITLSYPQWMVEYFLRTFGKEGALEFCRWGNEHHGVYLRVNTLKTTRDQIEKTLTGAEIEVRAEGPAPETLLITKGSGAVLRSPQFSAGEFIVQGAASQLAAHALNPHPGSRVLDLAAAPGGKTTHLAALMENTGEIHAFDLHQHKIQLIEDNARRLGITIITAQAKNSARLGAAYNNWADYVMLDAPCSGLGVLNARPDSRYHKQEQAVAELAATSYDMLKAAAHYVRPGGVICYSTCTVTKEENIDNVHRFLTEQPNFVLDPLEKLIPWFPFEEDKTSLREGMIQLLPQKHNTEGFFIAKLRRMK